MVVLFGLVLGLKPEVSDVLRVSTRLYMLARPSPLTDGFNRRMPDARCRPLDLPPRDPPAAGGTATSSERNPALPRNEIVLAQLLRFGEFAAGNLDDVFKQRLCILLDRLSSVHDRPAVKVYYVGHTLCKR